MNKKTKGGDGMTKKWFFYRDGDTVGMRARFEGDGGLIGDAFDQVRPGEEAFGLSYQTLFDARAGVLIVENEQARIVKDDEPTV